jgi:hypothetical protein
MPPLAVSWAVSSMPQPSLPTVPTGARGPVPRVGPSRPHSRAIPAATDSERTQPTARYLYWVGTSPGYYASLATSSTARAYDRSIVYPPGADNPAPYPFAGSRNHVPQRGRRCQAIYAG